MVEVLSGQSREMRVKAANELAEYEADAKEALPALVKMLNDEDAISDVRIAAANALGAIGSEAMDAVPDLVGALKDKRKRVQKAVGKALVMIYEK
jgi:HEAT repeat protein